ncbi:MAG: DUF6876 family protein [Roseiarcus sp.]|jgi:uncharacterized protein DUF6876
MTITREDLDQFLEMGHLHRRGPISSVVYTDGVKYLADEADANWLIDEIVRAQRRPKVAGEAFQTWKLKVEPSQQAVLICRRPAPAGEDGADEVVFKKRIDFTDFPLDEVSLYCVKGMLMLPNEY